MRHATVASILLLMTATLDATAQTTAAATADVRAAVSPRPLSLTAAGVTDFGIVTAAEIQLGHAAISPRAARPGQSTAMFTASGEPNMAVSVTCTGDSQLVLSGNPSHFVVFRAAVAFGQFAGSPGQAFDGCSEPSSFQAGLPASGEFYMWLGGQLRAGNPTHSTIAGVYTGFYTLTISY